MHIVTKNVTQLTPMEYRACHNANLGQHGYMMFELQHARNDEYRYRGTRAVMLWSDTNHDKVSKLLGWCLLTPSDCDGMIFVSDYHRRNCKYSAEFYVKHKHRRKGYGTMLMKHVVRHYEPRPVVVPYDRRSGELFSKFNVRLHNQDYEAKKWMVRKPKVA